MCLNLGLEAVESTFFGGGMQKYNRKWSVQMLGCGIYYPSRSYNICYDNLAG